MLKRLYAHLTGAASSRIWYEEMIAKAGFEPGIRNALLRPFTRTERRALDRIESMRAACEADQTEIVIMDQRATIRYFEQVTPSLRRRNILVFDDIDWSDAMRAAWQQITTKSRGYALSNVGVCISSVPTFSIERCVTQRTESIFS